MLITGSVCGQLLPEFFFPVFCSLRNHRCHYTTSSVNVNSFKAFFSSNKTKKSDLRKRKSHFLCNMHVAFSSSLLSRMKKSCIACGNFPKTGCKLI